MMWKRIAFIKNLAKKAKSINRREDDSDSLLVSEADDTSQAVATKGPTGTFAVYVGQERVKCMVPTSYLSHPLFRMLLEKSHDEFHCFEEKVMLVVPCSHSLFQDVLNAIESCNVNFDFGDFVEEFL
ncbi:unnamed protein product [Eruca vesicaria subsp. sativa]|uniref:Uncharacterized protein n=1 Tax=Eruca vesicaria subsp. sativa TaxID=29727 RepID=A0ABC8JV28_ERUVS|nr:unnamed protein product [Eruca vesicaria subsp. sativa]